jgi:glycosyltransferase involved in cell wall biosynthesis
MSVSIVIPAHQAERTLGATLESALAQAQADQIIVVDDGSTDTTLAIAHEFAAAHVDRVEVLTGPNQGVSSARNRGLKHARNDWLVFLDSDDLLLPDTLQQRLQYAANGDVVVCDFEEFGEGISTRVRDGNWHLIDSEGAELACAGSFWVPPAALMMKTAAVRAIGGFRIDLPVIQDARLLFDLARYGQQFVRAKHLGARYRVVTNSLSRRSQLRFWQDVHHNGQLMEALWITDGSLNQKQRVLLQSLYESAASVFFTENSTQWRAPFADMQRLGGKARLRFRIGILLAKIVGQTQSNAVFGFLATLKRLLSK